MNFDVIIERLKLYPIAVAGVLVLVLILGSVLIRGDITEDLEIRKSDLESRLRTIERNTSNSRQLSEQVDEIESILAEVDARLFSRGERSVNVNFFYAFEDFVDVVISDVSQLEYPDALYDEKGPRALKTHSTIVFEIEVLGTFADILLFSDALGRSDSLIRVASLEISRGQSPSGADQLTGQLRVLVLATKG